MQFKYYLGSSGIKYLLKPGTFSSQYSWCIVGLCPSIFELSLPYRTKNLTINLNILPKILYLLATGIIGIVAALGSKMYFLCGRFLTFMPAVAAVMRKETVSDFFKNPVLLTVMACSILVEVNHV